MSPTEYYPSCFPAYSASRAQGPLAHTVWSLFNEVQSQFLASQSFGGPIRKTIAELTDAFLDCYSPDWDGYKALAVKPQSYQNARRFLETLNGVLPQPSIGVDPDGEISLEWYRGPRLRFSLSIGPDSTIAYAGMFGINTVHGTETFIDELPASIVQNLRRLYRMPV